MSIPADDLATHLVRVARDGSRQVGFYLLMIPGCGTDGEGELDYLFVGNDQQGRGLGGLLIDDLCERSAERGLRRLHVVSYPPSEPFGIQHRRLGVRLVPGLATDLIAQRVVNTVDGALCGPVPKPAVGRISGQQIAGNHPPLTPKALHEEDRVQHQKIVVFACGTALSRSRSGINGSRTAHT
ncbi:GNAT family N-acetyltransferase [Saccharopolyspora spinosa]|uniref:Acetyltransferase (GNAT) family protein n=1 Tax=Saccharopolyspora spinosa TaxID=60894 RepID=A0A2N3Y6E0_SACSN|nr:GNAT family N-acetyltransferase [Saccharopolyspora spinosa]PKW18455.1 acetyltransferase (GNAT) family protein [Saccharopolyspora spinosa]